MKPILFLLISLTIISCDTETDSYKLDGKAIGFKDGTKVIVNTLNENNQTKVIDTLVITAESFTASYPKTDVLSINFLQIENVKGNILYFPENTDLKVTLYKDDMQSSFVTGSKQNDAYREFNKNMIAYNNYKKENSQRFKQARRDQNAQLANDIQKENKSLAQDEINYKAQFVSDNPNSLFSVLLLTEMLNRKEISAAETASIIQKFSPKLAATTNARTLNNLVSNMKKADVGGLAPNFSAPSPEGEILALNDVLGKYTIIDFWASWCKPCRRENPNVVRVYKQYHNKGLNIISVSLDKAGQKDRWLKAIEDDQMDWYHVSNLQGWNEPIAKMYSVRSIPATFLLDEEGNIIAKNLRGNALDSKIASLLGE